MHVIVACMDMTGHFAPLLPIMAELLSRGHKVTAFLQDDLKYLLMLRDFGLSAVTVIPVKLPDSLMKPKNATAVRPSLPTILSLGGPLAYQTAPLFDAIIKHPAAPALVVADFFTPAARDAADVLGVPCVVVFPNPLSLLSLVAPALRTRLLDPLRTAAASVAESGLARVLLALRNRERSQRSLPPLREQDLYPCATMERPFIVTTVIGFEYPHAIPPLCHFVGPTPPAKYPQLSEEMGQWLDRQQRPVVFVAFGTMHVFSQKDCRALLASLEVVIAQGTAAVLWALPTEQQALLPDGALAASAIRVEGFVAQYALLAHPKVSAFVSHCGANSVGEALLAQTPLVCCPGMADQPANAARLHSSGCGVLVEGGAGGSGVVAAIQQVLENQEAFAHRLASMRGMIAAAGGAKRAVDVLENVEALGFGHLDSGVRRAPWGRRLVLGAIGCAAVLAATWSTRSR